MEIMIHFPLWYLQDVEGVRRDVKIANLSLLNTTWYIRELKDNDPYHVGKVKMNLSDAQIETLNPIRWKATKVTIPFPNQASTPQGLSDFKQKFDIADTANLKPGGITFNMNPTVNFGNVQAIRIQDIMVKEIIQANDWERPIYFAVTCSEDSKIGLSDYLRMEGMALRLVPEKRPANGEFIDEKILKEQLFNENPGYSKDYKPGFKFRGLANPNIFFDDNHVRMMQNYRNAFIRLALNYLYSGRKNLTIATLDKMEEKIPRSHIPIDNIGLLYQIANIYMEAGAMDKYKEIAVEVEQQALEQIAANPGSGISRSYYDPYRILLSIYESLNENGKLLDLWKQIQGIYPNDPNVKANVARYQKLVDQGKNKPNTDSLAKAKSDSTK